MFPYYLQLSWWGFLVIHFFQLWTRNQTGVFRTVCSGNLQGRCIMNATRTVTSYVPLQHPKETEEERAELWWVPVGSHGIIKLQDFFFWAQTILTHFILCHNKIQLWGLLLWHFLCLYAEDAKCKWSERNFHIAIKRSKNIISSESHNWGNLSGTHRIILNQIWSSYYYWQICETLWLHVIQKGSDHIHWHQIW